MKISAKSGLSLTNKAVNKDIKSEKNFWGECDVENYILDIFRSSDG